MPRASLLLCVLAIVALSGVSAFAEEQPKEQAKFLNPALAAPPRVSSDPKQCPKSVFDAYARLPMSFELNKGQVDPRVKFISRGPGYTLFLTPTEAVFSLRHAAASPPSNSDAATPLAL
jgi:hypothetical protein